MIIRGIGVMTISVSVVGVMGVELDLLGLLSTLGVSIADPPRVASLLSLSGSGRFISAGVAGRKTGLAGAPVVTALGRANCKLTPARRRAAS